MDGWMTDPDANATATPLPLGLSPSLHSSGTSEATLLHTHTHTEETKRGGWVFIGPAAFFGVANWEKKHYQRGRRPVCACWDRTDGEAEITRRASAANRTPHTRGDGQEKFREKVCTVVAVRVKSHTRQAHCSFFPLRTRCRSFPRPPGWPCFCIICVRLVEMAAPIGCVLSKLPVVAAVFCDIWPWLATRAQQQKADQQMSR